MQVHPLCLCPTSIEFHHLCIELQRFLYSDGVPTSGGFKFMAQMSINGKSFML